MWSFGNLRREQNCNTTADFMKTDLVMWNTRKQFRTSSSNTNNEWWVHRLKFLFPPTLHFSFNMYNYTNSQQHSLPTKTSGTSSFPYLWLYLTNHSTLNVHVGERKGLSKSFQVSSYPLMTLNFKSIKCI
jgi:hypothetical protein